MFRHRNLRASRLALLAVFWAALIMATFAGPAEASAANSWPNSIASTGDSITRAFNTSWFPFIDAPANSWSTGTNNYVSSHYSRILAKNPKIRGKNYNNARSGARMADLNGQMVTTASQKPQYVTVLMGANDVCSPAYSQLDQPSIDKFGADFDTALKTLVTGVPTTRIFVSSIPNILHLWEINYTNPTARTVWSAYDICQSMLANPGSTAPADIARRAAVDLYTQNLNLKLQAVCGNYTQCKYDGGASYNYSFSRADVSTIDYFHPSLTGQKTLANITWQNTFNFAA